MDPTEFSLADFYLSDTSSPLEPPPEFRAWREAGSWAVNLYEPLLHGPAVPRVEIERGGSCQPVINLSSYNYLGLAAHPEVVEAARAALDRYGTGACGSPLLSGLSDLHRQLERALATFLHREDVMLFNSGFGGAMGALSGLLRRDDVVVLDEKIHLSLIAGATLARATIKFFKHNQPESLDEELSNTSGRRLVVVEGVYSMDGDFADLPALVEVAERHKVGMFIDEAHSFLACGPGGRGAAAHFGVADRIGLMFGTLSKALAGVGGFVAGSRALIEYLRCYSHPYGFSCALPPSVVAGVLKGLEIATRDQTLVRRVQDNARYFRERLLALGYDIGASQSQVVPIIVGADRRRLYELCHELQRAGLYLAPVDYPSVPEDSLRFRAAVTAAHTKEDLDQALEIIAAVVPARRP